VEPESEAKTEAEQQVGEEKSERTIDS
jgi:hypothetical protein